MQGNGHKSLIFNNMAEKEIPIASACVEDDGDGEFSLIHNIYSGNYFSVMMIFSM